MIMMYRLAAFFTGALSIILMSGCEQICPGGRNNVVLMGDVERKLYSAYVDAGYWPDRPSGERTWFEVCLMLVDVDEFDDSYYIWMDLNFNGDYLGDYRYDESADEYTYEFEIPSGTYALGSFELDEMTVDIDAEIMDGGEDRGSYYRYDVASGNLQVKHSRGNVYKFSFDGEFENGERFEFTYDGELRVISL